MTIGISFPSVTVVISEEHRDAVRNIMSTRVIDALQEIAKLETIYYHFQDHNPYAAQDGWFKMEQTN